MKILLASNNPKKAHELRTILANSGIEILTLADVPHYDEPIETAAPSPITPSSRLAPGHNTPDW